MNNVLDLLISFQIGSAVCGLDSLAQEASLLASNYVRENAASVEGGQGSASMLSPSALTASAELIVGLQSQALLLSSELRDSRSQLQALQLRTAERDQSEEIALAMAKAAERQSDLSLNEVVICLNKAKPINSFFYCTYHSVGSSQSMIPSMISM